MIKIDQDAEAFVARYRDLPIAERMLLSIEKQVARFGKEGARIAGILENAGTRNGAAVQHYYGDKDTLIHTAFLYRYKVFNDWSEHYLALLDDSKNAEPLANHLLLGINGAWGYCCKQTLPYCYHAGFIQKMGLDNPGISGIADEFSWSGPMRALIERAIVEFSQAIGQSLAERRMPLGVLQLVSAWAAKEREIRAMLSEKAASTGDVVAEIDRFTIEMTEALCANLFREKYRPFKKDPLALLNKTAKRCGAPVWHYEPGSVEESAAALARLR